VVPSCALCFAVVKRGMKVVGSGGEPKVPRLGPSFPRFLHTTHPNDVTTLSRCEPRRYAPSQEPQSTCNYLQLLAAPIDDMAGDDHSSCPPNDTPTSSATAKNRLAQVSSHITPATQKRRRRRTSNPESDLPADYSDVLGQIATLRTIAATPDPNNRGYVRQKQAGKLWVRERVEQLLDQGSFQEVGSVSGTVKWRQLDAVKEEPEEFVPSNNVQGFGRLRGRKIVFTADDFSIRAGHADGALMDKTVSL